MAIAIFIFTITLIIWQALGLGIGVTALMGAILSLIAGIVTGQDIFTLGAPFGNATLTLIALIIFSLILHQAGGGRGLVLLAADWG